MEATPVTLYASRRLAQLEAALQSEAWTDCLLPMLTSQRDKLATAVLDDDNLPPVEREAKRNRYRALEGLLTGLHTELLDHCRTLKRAGALDPRFEHYVSSAPEPGTPQVQQGTPEPEARTGMDLFSGSPEAVGDKLYKEVMAKINQPKPTPESPTP